jgi:hypothetical protein
VVKEQAWFTTIPHIRYRTIRMVAWVTTVGTKGG